MRGRQPRRQGSNLLTFLDRHWHFLTARLVTSAYNPSHMRRAPLFVSMIAATLALAAGALYATQQNAVESVVGTVTGIDKNARNATIKTDTGTVITLKTNDDTVCLRIPANEKTLAKAVPIQFAEIAVGDRMLGHGTRRENEFLAQRLVVITKADVDKKREGDLDDWRRRGIGGIVKDLNAQTGQVNLELRGSGSGGGLMILTAKADFRRYTSGSLRFEDAQPSNFAELNVGDQLRALGEKSGDGATFKAERIVSGSFSTIGATVTDIDLQRNEIKATTLDQRKPIVISLTKDSVLHRIPPPVAVAIAQRAMASKPASAGGSSSQAPPTQKGAPAANQSIDVQQVIDGLPKISAVDLKAGDVLAVTSAIERDGSHMTAIKLVAGVDLVLKAMAPQPGKPQVVRLSAGLPTVFDFSVVQ